MSTYLCSYQGQCPIYNPLCAYCQRWGKLNVKYSLFLGNWYEMLNLHNKEIYVTTIRNTHTIHVQLIWRSYKNLQLESTEYTMCSDKPRRPQLKCTYNLFMYVLFDAVVMGETPLYDLSFTNFRELQIPLSDFYQSPHFLELGFD